MQRAAESRSDFELPLTASDDGTPDPRGWDVSRADVAPALLDRFRRACGQHSPVSIHVSAAAPGDEPTPVPWNRPSLIVGSGEGCDLRLPHAEVSSRHAYFQFLDGRLYCADLASDTGTHWANGASQAGWVQANEPVAIGPYSLTFAFESQPRTSDAAEPASPRRHDPIGSADTAEMPAAADMFLDFVNVGPNVRRYRVTREVTLIGSGDAVKIHLMHPSVANVHCGVVRTPTGLWLVDFLSGEGTIVNGHVEPLAALQPGDEFQVGRFLVAVHYGLADEARGPSPQTSSEMGKPANPPTPSTTPHQASQPSAEDAQPPGRSIAENPAAPPGSDPKASDSAPVVRPTPKEGFTWEGEAPAEPLPPDTQQAVSARPEPRPPISLTPKLSLDPARQASNTPPAATEGLSEQFVLNVVKELGVMQQQCLQQVQDSLREALVQLSSTYEQRLEALEREQAALRKQLADRDLIAKTITDQGTPSEMRKRGDEAALPPTGTPNGAAVSGQQRQETQDPAATPAADTPKPPSPPDANDRGHWIREQIKSIELELETTGRGWEKKLVELLGH